MKSKLILYIVSILLMGAIGLFFSLNDNSNEVQGFIPVDVKIIEEKDLRRNGENGELERKNKIFFSPFLS